MTMAAASSPLIASDLVLKPGARPVTHAFGAGRITCLAGLDGHGQEAFLETLAGWNQPAGGAVRVRNSDREDTVRGGRQAHRLGIAYLPRDRRSNGIFPSLSILDNFAICSAGRDNVAGLASMSRRKRRFAKYRDMLSVVAGQPENPITSLSGGNQQKVLIARLLATDPRILLLNDPTRGVDVATRQTLYGIFRKLAQEGMTLVLVSTEIEEAVELSDEVVVFRDHAISAVLSGHDKTNHNVLSAMFGENA
ncbi:ATP-binding cassette domain-containing protein [Oricola thermophila]|uniref:Sugar ABC transporter ATP-binding protein n=1 Tax=Oricola thermophila TaxID=2742145 RepID=A0A6N1VHB0_9HYPH|nr:ATP-binding cassette domain-containing protein [Oricola thermophila]QKV19085.1 sugar ABC transporter ATP-binding protein [Oricola thermophila]